jgi:hypothetical protein
MSRLARPFAALFALWFAIVLGDPGMLHACPMHGSHGASATATQEHAVHQHGAAHHAAAGEQAQQPDESAPCTCIGHCCAVSISAPIVATEVLVDGERIVVAGVQPEYPRADAPAAPDVRLPFANAPPRA